MNRDPLLERRGPLGIPYALLILAVFFFFIPFSFRAARLSLEQKENDVKDWLPSDFPETAELEWFADHFAGESFVLATWPGCTRDDQRLKIFEQKLIHESDTFDPSSDFPIELAETYQRAKKVGNELQLLRAGSDFYNWGGREEKWLCTPSGQWYFITPDGRLYRWEAKKNAIAAALRGIQKSTGSFELEGTFVTAFGQKPGSRVANPFYNDTSVLCASLFHSVQTGETIVDELAREGGSLWPVDFTDEDRREVVARRLAMQRLTGTLFAPAMGSEFNWTPAAFREAIPADRRDQLPEDFDAIVEATLAQQLEVTLRQYAGTVPGSNARRANGGLVRGLRCGRSRAATSLDLCDGDPDRSCQRQPLLRAWPRRARSTSRSTVDVGRRVGCAATVSPVDVAATLQSG